MYTANTIASCSEALGMTLPGSSSYPAEYPEKLQEADDTGAVMRNLLEKDIKPRDIMTRSAFEDAIVSDGRKKISDPRSVEARRRRADSRSPSYIPPLLHLPK